MTKTAGVIVSVSELAEAKKLIEMKDRVRVCAEELFKEIEVTSGRSIPTLGICLHDQFSAQLCAPLPHLPAWYSERVIHFLADVNWWKKDCENLLKEKRILDLEKASQVIKQYCEELDLESLIYFLCGHEACHHLRLFEEDERYYRVAPRWIEEGLCFYLPYTIVGKKKERLFELAVETDRLVFDAFKEPFSKKEHWLYEFYEFDAKYTKAGENLKNRIDLWDYSASTLAVFELVKASRKNPRGLIEAISSSYGNAEEDHDKVKANLEFVKNLFEGLGIRTLSFSNYCLKFRICPVTSVGEVT